MYVWGMGDFCNIEGDVFSLLVLWLILSFLSSLFSLLSSHSVSCSCLLSLVSSSLLSSLFSLLSSCLSLSSDFWIKAKWFFFLYVVYIYLCSIHELHSIPFNKNNHDHIDTWIHVLLETLPTVWPLYSFIFFRCESSSSQVGWK